LLSYYDLQAVKQLLLLNAPALLSPPCCIPYAAMGTGEGALLGPGLKPRNIATGSVPAASPGQEGIVAQSNQNALAITAQLSLRREGFLERERRSTERQWVLALAVPAFLRRSSNVIMSILSILIFGSAIIVEKQAVPDPDPITAQRSYFKTLTLNAKPKAGLFCPMLFSRSTFMELQRIGAGFA
jgi:hypothetical protein